MITKYLCTDFQKLKNSVYTFNSFKGGVFVFRHKSKTLTTLQCIAIANRTYALISLKSHTAINSKPITSKSKLLDELKPLSETCHFVGAVFPHSGLTKQLIDENISLEQEPLFHVADALVRMQRIAKQSRQTTRLLPHTLLP